MRDVQAFAANVPVEPGAMDQPLKPPASTPAFSSAAAPRLEISRMDYKRTLGVHHLGDLRAAARRRLPKAIFDYVEGGSYDEVTLRANRQDLASLRLRQRVLVEVGSRSLVTTIAGEAASLPLALGPIGFSGLVRRGGEVEAARAAKIFGIPCCLSTFSTCSLEEVAAQSSASLFFQLYLFNDRGVNVTLIDKAKQARCKALVLTVDAAMHGRRNRDLDNGLVVPLRVRTKLALQMLAKPRWMYGWFSGRRTLGNLAMFVPPGGNELAAVSAWTERNCKGFATAADVEWVRQNWPGKLIIKGILSAEDARRAVELGADAIVVSNHGGRQLDSAVTAVQALPEIRSAIGESAELLFDGGVRSGLDVLKALGLGAKACLLGRAYLYGLAAYGERGVCAALQLIAEELDFGMAMTGVSDVRALPARLLD
jgi:L-lactate dehydrogenase (cytochrome)